MYLKRVLKKNWSFFIFLYSCDSAPPCGLLGSVSITVNYFSEKFSKRIKHRLSILHFLLSVTYLQIKSLQCFQWAKQSILWFVKFLPLPPPAQSPNTPNLETISKMSCCNVNILFCQGAHLAQDRGKLEAKIEVLTNEIDVLKKQKEQDSDTIKIKNKIVDDQTETIRRLKEVSAISYNLCA